MGLTTLTDLLQRARKGGYAVGYFEAWDLYSFEAVLEAAEAENAPVVLGFGGMMMDAAWIDRFGVEPLGAYGRAVAEKARVPVALILNEVWHLEQAKRGARAGFNAVMVNTCHLPYDENAAITRELVEMAHPLGVEVQAELGRLPDFGKDGEGALTDPDEAARFVRDTDVDCLAVSVGNVHLRTEGESAVDLERLQRIREKVDAPLVIHGGSGFPDAAVSAAIREGVALFHVGSIMKKIFFHAAHNATAAASSPFDYQQLTGCRKDSDFLMPGKAAIVETVAQHIRLYGASGKA